MSAPALLSAGVLVIGGCATTGEVAAPSQTSPPSARASAGHTRHAVPAEVDEPNDNAGLAQLARLSDAVVMGEVVSLETGIALSSDPTALYTVATYVVRTRVKGIAGRAARVALLTSLGGGPFEIAGREIPTVGSRSLLFLSRIAPEFSYDGFVLSSSGSLVPLATDGAVRTTSTTPAAVEMQELGTVSRVVARLLH